MAQYYKWRGGQNEFPYAPYDLKREVERADWGKRLEPEREKDYYTKYRTREEFLKAKADRERARRDRMSPEQREAENTRKRRSRHERQAKKLGITVEEYLATRQQYGVKAA